jgi:hypothetical protein
MTYCMYPRCIEDGDIIDGLCVTHRQLHDAKAETVRAEFGAEAKARRSAEANRAHRRSHSELYRNYPVPLEPRDWTGV